MRRGGAPVSARQSSTATDEVHDLQAIAFAQQLFAPRASGSNLPVQFDGDAIGFQAETVDEMGERKPFGTLFGLAVHDHGHISSVTDALGATICSVHGELMDIMAAHVPDTDLRG